MKSNYTVSIPLYATIEIDVMANSQEEAEQIAFNDCLNISVDSSEMVEDHQEHIELLPYKSIIQGAFSNIPITEIESKINDLD